MRFPAADRRDWPMRERGGQSLVRWTSKCVSPCRPEQTMHRIDARLFCVFLRWASSGLLPVRYGKRFPVDDEYNCSGSAPPTIALRRKTATKEKAARGKVRYYDAMRIRFKPEEPGNTAKDFSIFFDNRQSGTPTQERIKKMWQKCGILASNRPLWERIGNSG